MGLNIKAPKEPKTFKHPRIYLRPDFDDSNGDSPVCELLIIYPKRRGDIWGYALSERPSMVTHLFEGEGLEACWDYGQFDSPHSAVRAMKKFARSKGHKTVFIGEIK